MQKYYDITEVEALQYDTNISQMINMYALNKKDISLSGFLWNFELRILTHNADLSGSN
jgi:hypothetical protein